MTLGSKERGLSPKVWRSMEMRASEKSASHAISVAECLEAVLKLGGMRRGVASSMCP